jgi:DNA-directed RNA polymerase subunit RPC12/RpoP
MAVEAKGIEQFNCPGCGSQLLFDAGEGMMECRHCGHKAAIEKSNSNVIELKLQQGFHSYSTVQKAPVEEWDYHCTRCGAQAIFSSETPTFTCTKCNYSVVNAAAFKTRVIQPAGMIPFCIEKEKALSCFKDWINKSFWAPNDIKKLARADGLHGKYLPFWTFDAQTVSDWSGYGGRYVTVRGSNGKTRTETEWHYRSGRYEHQFDDLLIETSTELTEQESASIQPFDTSAAVNFDPQYLSGWQAEVADTELETGYQHARKIMETTVYNICRQKCTINTYKDLQVATTIHNETFKQVLLPVWLCSYRYKDKTLHFLINGQTGKISGNKPVSWIKVSFAILLVLIVVYFIAKAQSE